ncbi:uncharacterized protein SPPG_08546 [Spizellomyces punctatus DAOM BR117]|uniref:Oxidation resistance protein 1 n=1 Tax=Spizellomyces punctatus (strain DAOM BR117) TaxID=645134 RepID=A0A0L0H623_SPIPD|nr:uncharacterized protein SPPG_08546 [Spizellomyces punctatus DAOM BR117]KNC96158.1 hypothetical protein SPPG_08546 [Spizellomyces punctatus DAOM BR117]|eukprot:XP_016604198.1 hypothetical protein SPPG_08546 [Spizellomyces punctatus DAOM BR117]
MYWPFGSKQQQNETVTSPNEEQVQAAHTEGVPALSAMEPSAPNSELTLHTTTPGLPPPRLESLSSPSDQVYPTSFSGFFWEMLGLSSPNVGEGPYSYATSSNRELSQAFNEYEGLDDEEPTVTLPDVLAEAAPIPPSVTNMPASASTMVLSQSAPDQSSVKAPVSGMRLSLDSLFRRRSSLISPAPLGDEGSKVTEDPPSPISPFEEISRPPIALIGRKDDIQTVLDHNMAEQLRLHLPPILREAPSWILVYSMEQHGISLNTLYKRSEGQDAALLAIRDGSGGIFGAFGSEALNVHAGYYGTGACFLWKLLDGGDIKVFPATGHNDYLMLSEPHFIAFGGGEGHFGLWIDDELYNGHSGPCQTFDNEKLSTTSEFEIVGLEVWTFKM